MPTFELTVILKQDGVTRPGFPILRRIETPEFQDSAAAYIAFGDTLTFAVLEARRLNTINFLVVSTDQPVAFRFNDDVDGADHPVIPIRAGGMIIFVDTVIDAGSGSPNARVNNNSGATAEIRLLAAGE